LTLAWIIASCKTGSQKEKSGDSNDSIPEQLADLNRQIARDPDNPLYLHHRADYFMQQGLYEPALKDVNKAILLDSLNPDLYITRGEVLVSMGNLRESVMSLDNAVSLDPKNIKAWLKLAEVSILFGNYTKSVEYLDKVLTLDRYNAKAYYFKGMIFLETGDTTRGTEFLKQAAQFDPEFFDANLQLGILHAARKDRLALDYYNTCLNIEPGNPEVEYNIGLFYQETGDLVKAMQVYEKIINLHHDFSKAYYNMGYISLVYFKHFSEAARYFTAAIRLDSAYVDAWYNRGFSYELMERTDSARHDYRQALDIEVNYPKAVEALNRLDRAGK
jgi:tetratricopeptide (TPR) repeat protein